MIRITRTKYFIASQQLRIANFSKINKDVLGKLITFTYKTIDTFI